MRATCSGINTSTPSSEARAWLGVPLNKFSFLNKHQTRVRSKERSDPSHWLDARRQAARRARRSPVPERPALTRPRPVLAIPSVPSDGRRAPLQLIGHRGRPPPPPPPGSGSLLATLRKKVGWGAPATRTEKAPTRMMRGTHSSATRLRPRA